MVAVEVAYYHVRRILQSGLNIPADSFADSYLNRMRK